MNDPNEYRQKTCEERVDNELASTVKDLDRMFKIEDGDNEEAREENYEELVNYTLAIGVEKVYTIQMSTGGPGDQFEVYKDAEGDTTKIVYRFLDWFDGAERRIDLESETGKTVERYCDYILEGYISE